MLSSLKPFGSVPNAGRWVEPGADPPVAERAAIMRPLAQGAALLNIEARVLGEQLPLL
jgi:hypothetical protein